MKYRFILIFIWLSLNNSFLNAQEHLEPVPGIFDLYEYQFEYYSNIRKVLFSGLTDSPKARFFIKPSFEPESVLDIEYDYKLDEYCMVYQVVSESIWDSENKKSIKVKRFEKEISANTAELIISLFSKAVSTTKKPIKDNDGNDGTDFYFTVRDGHQISGKIWSPKKGSKMRELVEVSNEIIKIMTDEEKTVFNLNSRLTGQIINLKSLIQ